MNTIKSFWVGWGTLIVAGGGAYYFAKKSINEDRQARFDQEETRRRRLQESLEYGGKAAPDIGGNGDSACSPSQEKSAADPAPTRHAPENEKQRVAEKSKYEASEPFRSKKGDRFS